MVSLSVSNKLLSSRIFYYQLIFLLDESFLMRLIYLFSGADSLDKEDSLSNQEQGHMATSISEAYGLCTASVKVRAHFKIFHHCRSLPSCNSMKHCILTCK
jgi:hypothetical protein